MVFPALPFPSLPMDNGGASRGIKRDQDETGAQRRRQQRARETVCGGGGGASRCALTAVPFPRAGLRRVKIKRESDGAVVGELKTEKEEGLEEEEALWVKGDGSGVVKRAGEDGGAEVEEEEEEGGEKGGRKCVDCGEKWANYGFEDGKKRFCAACGKRRGALRIGKKVCVDCKLVRPHYKLPGENIARYCGPCGKAKGAVRKEMCKDCGKKTPFFGQPGGSAS